MSCKVKDVMDLMESIAPKELTESWDNVGLMIGEREQEVKKILVALDCTSEVIDEALDVGADMIVTHHPFILFQKIKSIKKGDVLGGKIYKLIQNNISVFSAHTNLDCADGGINDILAELFELKNVEKLDEESGLGRIGELENSMKFEGFANVIESKLNTKGLLRLMGDKDKEIKRVAVCGGSGASFVSMACGKGADAYITGDIKFHEAQDGIDMGMCIADATHYSTEVVVVPVLADRLRSLEAEVVVSCVDGQVFWR